VPALLRAFVACGWFGIQAWIGGAALYQLAVVFVPSLKGGQNTFLGITISQFIAFMIFWAINMFVIYKGIDSIRILLNIKAPLLIVLGWRCSGGRTESQWLRPDAQPAVEVRPGPAEGGQVLALLLPALTAMVGFWATLSLNIPDFSRYAKTQRDQILGSARPADDDGALQLHRRRRHVGDSRHLRQSIWDPIELLTKFESKPRWSSR
jgi:NCS1 family nucleobase:cation symporter-1